MKFTKPWFEVPNELIKGDEIFFSAEVEQYKINRPDVLKQRDRIWNDAKKKQIKFINVGLSILMNISVRTSNFL